MSQFNWQIKLVLQRLEIFFSWCYTYRSVKFLQKLYHVAKHVFLRTFWANFSKSLRQINWLESPILSNQSLKQTLTAPILSVVLSNFKTSQKHFLNGTIPASFSYILVIFTFQYRLQVQFQFQQYKCGFHEIWTRCCRMVGGDETTELWRPFKQVPILNQYKFFSNLKPSAIPVRLLLIFCFVVFTFIFELIFAKCFWINWWFKICFCSVLSLPFNRINVSSVCGNNDHTLNRFYYKMGHSMLISIQIKRRKLSSSWW